MEGSRRPTLQSNRQHCSKQDGDFVIASNYILHTVNINSPLNKLYWITGCRVGPTDMGRKEEPEVGSTVSRAQLASSPRQLDAPGCVGSLITHVKSSGTTLCWLRWPELESEIMLLACATPTVSQTRLGPFRGIKSPEQPALSHSLNGIMEQVHG